MPTSHHPIDLTAAGPGHEPCGENHTIQWTNRTGHQITSFVLPCCVSPKTNPAPLDDGKPTITYTIDPGTKRQKPYDYSYSFQGIKIVNTQNGTIDVS
jgi:hypothetical protein